MNIRCSYDALVLLSELRPNPKNNNRHPQDQIERLAAILSYQGVRKPLIVSKQSGYLVTGHGTLEAIRSLGWDSAPVSYQDFDSPDQEYAHMTADNAIALWAELDLAAINKEIPELGPMDIGLLGMRDFAVDPSEKPPIIPDEAPRAAVVEMAVTRRCPNCQYEFVDK